MASRVAALIIQSPLRGCSDCEGTLTKPTGTPGSHDADLGKPVHGSDHRSIATIGSRALWVSEGPQRLADAPWWLGNGKRTSCQKGDVN